MTKKQSRERVPSNLLPKKKGKKSGTTNLTLATAPEVDGKSKAANDDTKTFDKPADAASLKVVQPPKKTIVGNRIEMFYLKPSFSRTKTGQHLISMHFSLALTEEHTKDGLLPTDVREGWVIMSKKRRKRFDLIDLPGQRVEFYMVSDIDDCKLALPVAKIVNASLAVILKKGDGQAQKIIRLSFRLQVPVSAEVEKFAVMNYGNNFWLTLKETSEKLFDDEEGEN